jgi:hypothetical protein
MKLDRHRRISPSVTEPNAKEIARKFIPCVLKVGVQVSPSDDHVGSDKLWTVTELFEDYDKFLVSSTALQPVTRFTKIRLSLLHLARTA